MKTYQKTISLGNQSRIITVEITDTGRHNIGGLSGGYYGDLLQRLVNAEETAMENMLDIEKSIVASTAILECRGFKIIPHN